MNLEHCYNYDILLFVRSTRIACSLICTVKLKEVLHTEFTDVHLCKNYAIV